MKTIKIKENVSYREMQESFISEIKTYVTKDVNVLLTNGNLATIIQDSAGYNLENLNVPKLQKGEDGRAKIFKLGKLEDLQIMVDPYMRWDDNRILLKNDEIIIEEIEIIDKNDSLI